MAASWQPSAALAHEVITEINAHALGARHLTPEVRTVFGRGRPR
jgi:activator of 2-hydroxyglutaryl-CoA dehydratase